MAQKERMISNNCNFFIFNIKNYVNTKITCIKCSFDYLHWLLNNEKLYRKDGVLLAVHTSGASPQSRASHLLTFLVTQLQFLREWKLSDRRLYEVFERRLWFEVTAKKEIAGRFKNMRSFCANLYLRLLISTRALPSGYTTGYLQSCLRLRVRWSHSRNGKGFDDSCSTNVSATRSLAFRRCPLAPTLTRLICLRFLSLGLPQIKSLRSKTSSSRRNESFHSRRNCNCATRNVSKCDAELWGEAPDVCTARRTPSFRYNFP